MNWPTLPPVATNREVWLRRVWLATIFLFAALVLLMQFAPIVRATQDLAMALILLIAVLAVAAQISRPIARKRGKRQLEAQGFQVCPSCRYSLVQLPSPGQCPECGRPFDSNDLRRLWSRAYTSPHWLYDE